jgi:hypothetical protein
MENDEQNLVNMKYDMNIIIYRMFYSKSLAELSCALQNFDQMIYYYEEFINKIYNMCIYEFVNTINLKNLDNEFKDFENFDSFENFHTFKLKYFHRIHHIDILDIIIYKLYMLLPIYNYKIKTDTKIVKQYLPHRRPYVEPQVSIINQYNMNKNKFKIILMYRYINLMKEDIYNKINVIENIKVLKDNIVLKDDKILHNSFFNDKVLDELIEAIENFIDMKNFYISSPIYKPLLDNFIDKKLLYIIPIIYHIINEIITYI